MNIPDNVPNGYSWLNFTFIGNRPVEELLDYAKSSELHTPPEKIVQRIQKFLDSHSDQRDEPEGWVMQYILDHPEMHYMLKEVNDGSYRKNRLLIRESETYGRSDFQNHDYERFLDDLLHGRDPQFSRSLDEMTKDEVIDSFIECMEEDQVIFIQFETLSDGMFPEEDYPDDDYLPECF